MVPKQTGIPMVSGKGEVKYPTIGQVVRVLREARGLSQGDLASRAKISRQTVSLIETEKVDPNFETVRRLMAELEYTVLITKDFQRPVIQ